MAVFSKSRLFPQPNKKLIAELRDQLHKAQETILQLQQILQAQSSHEGIKLTPNQRTVVDMLLVTNGICSNENLYAALYVSLKQDAVAGGTGAGPGFVWPGMHWRGRPAYRSVCCWAEA